MSGQSFEQNQTLTYEELIKSYEELAQNAHQASLFEMGATDSGRKLHLFVIHETPTPDLKSVAEKAKQNATLLINNGIHPGESCGIDASLQYASDLLLEGAEVIPEGVLIAIIPAYNIGGILNRGSFSRANQQGPEEHGFRGNARNLDLNRDFIKADALNTFSFYTIFHLLNPHVFVDTHTSNGADYQYTMTLISTQKDKLNPVLSSYMTSNLEPKLYNKMDKAGWEMTPYVNVFGHTPESGIAAFLETPRYASGYTTLFNTIGFITETHMLKPYQDRVWSTYHFLKIISQKMSEDSEKLMKLKKQAYAYDQELKTMSIDWKLDSSIVKELAFKGYEYDYIQSKVHSGKRLKYHRDKPNTFNVPYYNSYKSTQQVNVPEYYVIPAAWKEVAKRMQYNGVVMELLKKDTLIKVLSQYVEAIDFSSMPYEGHFLASDVKINERIQSRNFQKGDWLVYTNQPAKRFIVNTLEPMAVDAYLKWNFFDEIFQQKEWFSAYVFEDTAEELLKSDESLRKKYEGWQEANPDADAFSSLHFIYRNSVYYEETHMRYPIAKSVSNN